MNIKKCQTILNEVNIKFNDSNYIEYLKRSSASCGNHKPFVCCLTETPSETNDNDSAVELRDIHGRFLTVEEGCGFSNKSHLRSKWNNAKEGAWPWITLLGYITNLGDLSWNCSTILNTS